MQTSVDVVDNVGDEFDLNAYLVDWVDSVDLVDLPTHLDWNPFKNVRRKANISTRHTIASRLQNLNEKNAAKLDVFVYEVVKYGTKSRVFNNVNDCSDFMHQWKLDKHSIQTCAYEEDGTKTTALKELAEHMVAGPLQRKMSLISKNGLSSGVKYSQAMARLQKNRAFKSHLPFIRKYRPQGGWESDKIHAAVKARRANPESVHKDKQGVYVLNTPKKHTILGFGHKSRDDVVPSAKIAKSAKGAKGAKSAKQASPAPKQNAKHSVFGNMHKSDVEKKQDRSASKAAKRQAKDARVEKAKNKAAKGHK